MRSRIRGLGTGDDGASAVEYSLLVAAIAASVVLVVFLLGDVVEGLFTETCSELTSESGIEGDCGSRGPDGEPNS